MLSVSSHIINELTNRGIRYRVSNDWINVWCPYHRGSYFKLKLGIHRSGKATHCWVCGKQAGGGWNRFAKEMGLQTIDFDDPNVKNDFSELQYEIDSFEKKEKHNHSLPNGLLPWTGPWLRFNNGEDFDNEFLTTIPSYEWYDSESETYRILWPVVVNESLHGWIAARNNDTTEPKYRNSDQLPSSKVLFPFDHPIHFESVAEETDVPKQYIVLTEGPASALRLIKCGIPAVAILGVKNWNESKVALLIARGIKRVVLAFDGDPEGWECTRVAYKHLTTANIDVRVMDFPDGIDPANCTQRHIGLIKRMLK